MQNPVTKQAYLLLQKMTFSKNITESVRRSVRVRLIAILEAEQKAHSFWTEHIKHKLNATRQKQVQREYNKRIQALKIVIYSLTPYLERTEDVPTFIVKKNNMKKILTFVILFLLFVSCKKSNDSRTCWDCEVQRRDGTTYHDRPCTDNGFPPQYTDNLGNDLNCFCTKR